MPNIESYALPDRKVVPTSFVLGEHDYEIYGSYDSFDQLIYDF